MIIHKQFMMPMKIYKIVIQRRKGKCLYIDDIITDMKSNKTLSPIVAELFLRGKKVSILLVFISRSYFNPPKTIRLNATEYFIMKILNKRELQQIASNHSSEIGFKDFMKLYTKALFLVDERTLSSDNPLRFRKKFLKK